jgi:hypothetical protein
VAGKLENLEERKARLVARCDATRVEFIMGAQDLHRRTRWMDTTYQVVHSLAPKLKLLSPLIGLVLAGNLSRGPRVFGMVQSAWKIGQQIMPFVRGIRMGQGRA